MKWFRSNIKHGSRLALFALALQFAFSFGHFHALAAQATTAIQSGQTDRDHAGAIVATDANVADANIVSSRPQPASDRDSDQQPNDTCAICAVIALANTVLLATPPMLPLPQAVELPHLTADAGFIRLNSVRVAFQPRAPPLS